jgi:hypothetical protein
MKEGKGDAIRDGNGNIESDIMAGVAVNAMGQDMTLLFQRQYPGLF